MVTVYDLLRKSRGLGFMAIGGGALPFVLCLLFAYFVQGIGLWDELTDKNSSGDYPYLVWVWIMVGGVVWISIATSLMHSIELGMTPEQKETVEWPD